MQGNGSAPPRLSSPYDRWQAQLGGRQYGALFVVYYGFRDHPAKDLANNQWADSLGNADHPSLIDIRLNSMLLDCVMFKDSGVSLSVEDEHKKNDPYVVGFGGVSNLLGAASGVCAIVAAINPVTAVPWGVTSGAFAISSGLAGGIAIALSMDDTSEFSRGRSEIWGYLTITDTEGKPSKTQTGYPYFTDGEIKGCNGSPNTRFAAGSHVINGTLQIHTTANALTTWKLYEVATVSTYVQQGNWSQFKAAATLTFVPARTDPTTCFVNTPRTVIGSPIQQYVGED